MSNASNLVASEQAAVLGVVTPQTVTGATVTTGWISMQDFDKVLATIGVGLNATSVDAKIQEATDASGTGAIDITGKSITQITVADQVAEIDVDQQDLDVDNGFDHIQLSITTVGAAVVYGEVQGFSGHIQPVAQFNVSEVVEIV
jgi:hypothetical protein